MTSCSNCERKRVIKQVRDDLDFSTNILIIAIFFIGVITCCGYVFDNHILYDWGRNPMAVGTGICLVLTSLVLFKIHNYGVFFNE